MRRLFLLALPIALTACGSDNTTTGITLASLAGTWSLQTVNGAALPFTISTANGMTVQLLSDTVTVAANGAFTSSEAVKTTVNGQSTTTTLPSTGTISLSGTLVSVAFTGSGSGTGTLTSATQFSFTDPTTLGVFVFQKL